VRVLDNRAQSVGIGKFLLSLVVALILAWIVQTITDPILAEAESEATAPAAVESSAWFASATDSLFLFFLVIAVFGVVALAVYQREVLG